VKKLSRALFRVAQLLQTKSVMLQTHSPSVHSTSRILTRMPVSVVHFQASKRTSYKDICLDTSD